MSPFNDYEEDNEICNDSHEVLALKNTIVDLTMQLNGMYKEIANLKKEIENRDEMIRDLKNKRSLEAPMTVDSSLIEKAVKEKTLWLQSDNRILKKQNRLLADELYDLKSSQEVIQNKAYIDDLKNQITEYYKENEMLKAMLEKDEEEPTDEG